MDKNRWTLAELAKDFGLCDKDLRNMSQRMPIPTSGRSGKADLYESHEARVLVICMALRQAGLNRRAIWKFVTDFSEGDRRDFIQFRHFDYGLGGSLSIYIDLDHIIGERL